MSNKPQWDLCVLCGQDRKACNGTLGAFLGPLDDGNRSGVGVYVHRFCALWSSEVYHTADGDTLRNVGKAIRRGRQLRCGACGERGATLGCRVERCNVSYHLHCARASGCAFNVTRYLIACPRHAAAFKHETEEARRGLPGQMSERRMGGNTMAAARRLLPSNDSPTGRQPHGHQPPHGAAASGGGGPPDSSRDRDEAGRQLPSKRRKIDFTAAARHMLLARAAMAAARGAADAAATAAEVDDDEAVFAVKERRRHAKDTARLAPVMLVAGGGGGEGVYSRGFEAVGGLQPVIQSLREMVLLPLLHPGLMERLGVTGAAPPRGILLHGLPGTGKTLAVRALAGEVARRSPVPVALFARGGADVLGKYHGDAERTLRLLFEEARRRAPAIIFLDELDALAPRRSVAAGGSDQIYASVVATLLALMDGVVDRGQVVVIGATNRPDNLDPALRRPGRFDREVSFGLPGPRDREAVLRVHTARWRQPPPPELLERLAAATEGYAGADLEALCSSAVLAAVRRASTGPAAAAAGGDGGGGMVEQLLRARERHRKRQLGREQRQQQARERAQERTPAEREGGAGASGSPLHAAAAVAPGGDDTDGGRPAARLEAVDAGATPAVSAAAATAATMRGDVVMAAACGDDDGPGDGDADVDMADAGGGPDEDDVAADVAGAACGSGGGQARPPPPAAAPASLSPPPPPLSQTPPPDTQPTTSASPSCTAATAAKEGSRRGFAAVLRDFGQLYDNTTGPCSPGTAALAPRSSLRLPSEERAGGAVAVPSSGVQAGGATGGGAEGSGQLQLRQEGAAAAAARGAAAAAGPHVGPAASQVAARCRDGGAAAMASGAGAVAAVDAMDGIEQADAAAGMDADASSPPPPSSPQSLPDEGELRVTASAATAPQPTTAAAAEGTAIATAVPLAGAGMYAAGATEGVTATPPTPTPPGAVGEGSDTEEVGEEDWLEAVRVVEADWEAALAAAPKPCSRREAAAAVCAGLPPALPAHSAALVAPAAAAALLRLAAAGIAVPAPVAAAAASVSAATSLPGASGAASAFQPAVARALSAAWTGPRAAAEGVATAAISSFLQLLTTAGAVERKSAGEQVLGSSSGGGAPPAGANNPDGGTDGTGGAASAPSAGTAAGIPRQQQQPSTGPLPRGAPLQQQPCCHLLLCGEGDMGQDAVAAAVLRLLSAPAAVQEAEGAAAQSMAAAPPAVHTINLPAIVLRSGCGGGGVTEAAEGVAALVSEALTHGSRRQLHVLYLPRIDTWALEQQVQEPLAAVGAAWGSGDACAGDDGGVFGGAEGRGGGVGSTEDEDTGSDDRNGSGGEQEDMEDDEQQVASYACVSPAWSVFMQQAAAAAGALLGAGGGAAAGGGGLLVLATCAVPPSQLPPELLEFFGAEPQSEPEPGLPGVAALLAAAGWPEARSSARRPASRHTLQLSPPPPAAVEAAAVAAEAELLPVVRQALEVAALQALQHVAAAVAITGPAASSATALAQQPRRPRCEGQPDDGSALGDISPEVQKPGASSRWAAAAAEKQRPQHQQLAAAEAALGGALSEGLVNSAELERGRRLALQVQLLIRNIGATMMRRRSGCQLARATVRHRGGGAAAAAADAIGDGRQRRSDVDVVTLTTVAQRALDGRIHTLDQLRQEVHATADRIRAIRASAAVRSAAGGGASGHCRRASTAAAAGDADDAYGPSSTSTGVGYSRAAAAAAMWEDTVVASCEAASRSMQLDEPENRRLLAAALEHYRRHGGAVGGSRGGAAGGNASGAAPGVGDEVSGGGCDSMGGSGLKGTAKRSPGDVTGAMRSTLEGLGTRRAASHSDLGGGVHGVEAGGGSGGNGGGGGSGHVVEAGVGSGGGGGGGSDHGVGNGGGDGSSHGVEAGGVSWQRDRQGRSIERLLKQAAAALAGQAGERLLACGALRLACSSAGAMMVMTAADGAAVGKVEGGAAGASAANQRPRAAGTGASSWSGAVDGAVGGPIQDSDPHGGVLGAFEEGMRRVACRLLDECAAASCLAAGKGGSAQGSGGRDGGGAERLVPAASVSWGAYAKWVGCTVAAAVKAVEEGLEEEEGVVAPAVAAERRSVGGALEGGGAVLAAAADCVVKALEAAVIPRGGG